jgi:hypothetical protein
VKYYLRPWDRNKHVYITGKTRHGKSVLMHGMAYQDIKNGEGLCVIDAKGDLVPELLDWVPRHRRDDCIFLDLTTPIPIDFMDCGGHEERMSLVSDIVQIFERMDEGWGIRMDGILRYTVTSLALMGNRPFLDIYRALTEESFRQEIQRHPNIQSDPVLKPFWTHQAEKLIKSESTTGIAFSRMASFMLSPAFRVILGTAGGLNIAKAIEERKIILVKLKPNSDEAMLFGSLIVSKIQQAIFRRPSGNPFMLYVDEFQNFRSSGFEQILSMAGGLGLSLTLSNQYFNQLDTSVQDAIINNVSTFFLFRMGIENASRLRGELKEPSAPPKPDIKALKEKIKAFQKQEDFWDQRPGGSNEARICFEGRINLEAQLKEAERPVPERLTFLEKLPYLPVGQCVYRMADGTTTIIKTPPPPPHTIQVRKTSYAEYIKKRTVDLYSCNDPQVSHTESNESKVQTDYDNVQPGPPPNSKKARHP